MWNCLTLDILTQSHGILCLSALGLAVWHCAGHMMALQISGHLSQVTVCSWQGTVLSRALNEEPKTPASLDAEMGGNAAVSELRMLAGAG